MRKSSVSIVLVILWSVLSAGTAFSSDFLRYGSSRPPHAVAQDVLVINRPPSITGLTGLLTMNTAFTQKAGHMALGASVTAENSSVPDYSIYQGMATLTIGITDSLEIGGRGKLIVTEDGTTGARARGDGSTEAAIKWRIRNQSESAIIPAIAIGVGGIFPVNNDPQGYAEVQKHGVKVMLIASAESEVLDDIFVGIHFEGQAVFIDQSSQDPAPPTEDKYSVINAGLHFPFDETNHLQFILEYNQVSNKDLATLGEGDFSAMSVGLRYVAPYLNVTLGSQFMNKDDVNVDDTVRFIGTVSINY